MIPVWFCFPGSSSEYVTHTETRWGSEVVCVVKVLCQERAVVLLKQRWKAHMLDFLHRLQLFRAAQKRQVLRLRPYCTPRPSRVYSIEQIYMKEWPLKEARKRGIVGDFVCEWEGACWLCGGKNEWGREREGESIVGKYLWRLGECRSRHEGCFLEASLPQPIRT